MNHRYDVLQRFLIAVTVGLLVIIVAFHSADHAALFPPPGTTEVQP